MSSRCTVVGTWAFSREPVRKTMNSLLNSGMPIDAVEAGINLAEQDAGYGPYHVGCGGWQNATGVLELDAAIMDGKHLGFGAVTALQGFAPAISVARRVLERSQHNMLTGEGAACFARAQGFSPQQNLGTPTQQPSRRLDGKDEQRPRGHDTLGLLAEDRTGNLCAGVSTSGMSGKEPGRVGDSALPGCSLYADSAAGAACCSGDGDEILKYCPSYKVVDLLKQGFSPQEACLTTVKDIIRRRDTADSFQMVIIAMDNKGRHGAANVGVQTWRDDVSGEEFPGFPYVVISEEKEDVQIISVPPLLPEQQLT